MHEERRDILMAELERLDTEKQKLRFKKTGSPENVNGNKWARLVARREKSCVEKFIIGYIQEFIFKFIITMSAFISLFYLIYIFPTKAEINNIGIGYLLLLLFVFLWSIIGVSGYLTSYISQHKIPLINK